MVRSNNHILACLAATASILACLAVTLVTRSHAQIATPRFYAQPSLSANHNDTLLTKCDASCPTVASQR